MCMYMCTLLACSAGRELKAREERLGALTSGVPISPRAASARATAPPTASHFSRRSSDHRGPHTEHTTRTHHSVHTSCSSRGDEAVLSEKVNSSSKHPHCHTCMIRSRARGRSSAGHSGRTMARHLRRRSTAARARFRRRSGGSSCRAARRVLRPRHAPLSPRPR